MPRVTRSPRNSVKDRPAWIKLLLRRQKRLLRPAAWVAGTFVLHHAADRPAAVRRARRLAGNAAANGSAA